MIMHCIWGHMEPYVCHYFRKSDVLCSLSAAGRQRLSFEARGCWKFVALWKVILNFFTYSVHGWITKGTGITHYICIV